jgi:SP family myo-inositol transporter-like MFS transporter 13
MADAADQPLIGDDPGEDADIDLPDVSLLLEKNLRHPGVFVWLLTLSAGISGLLFGCRCNCNHPYDEAWLLTLC